MSDLKQEHLIRQISAPTIIVDDIVFEDFETGAANKGAINTGSAMKYSNVQGAEFPLIQINDFFFQEDQTAYMKIDTSGFLPTILVKLLIKSKVIYTSGFPKDGDILSIFIRSKDNSFKPIKNDYEITSVKVEGERKETTPEFMTISGVLYVEGLKNTKCYAKSGTSIEVIQKLADDLQLGFATNELSTKDKQVWLSSYKKAQDFIQEVTSAAWKDNKSFFTSFVDIFYNLNFVNVDPLFSIKPGKELGISIESYSTDYDVDSELIKKSMSILFTNHTMARYSSQWINKYEQVNQANSVNRSHGYVKFNHYYDALLRKKVLFFNDPLTSPNSENEKYIFKGRNATDQRFGRVTHDWMGTMYGGNGENQHPMYIYAQTWNFQNMIHLDKLYLNVELDQINMTLRKYQVIPLLIIVQEDAVRRVVNSPNDTKNATTPTTENTKDATSNELSEEELPFVVEKFYTGDYVIQDITYEYQKGFFKQKLKLLRREWPAPPQPSRNNNT
jgi:hypothetical protein